MPQNNKVKKKKINPLFVIKGGTVEEANNPLDYLVKKMGLAPVIEFLEGLFQSLISQVKDYVTLVNIQRIFENLVQQLETYIQSTLFILKDFIERNIWRLKTASVLVKK